jgi:hypothetical protein
VQADLEPSEAQPDQRLHAKALQQRAPESKWSIEEVASRFRLNGNDG